ncbi:hypothetical protein Y032_0107g3816 [Ancylostoma ceylanicum]|uniref:Uncharacterized protein n=1 Tax=Ancylostoma ceylanicum TaxID=53326 RepID=A0A016TFM3_9BILA|nr:hypothetical protein Y032_0107g3816 [Ancylostoma ceylanicum]
MLTAIGQRRQNSLQMTRRSDVSHVIRERLTVTMANSMNNMRMVHVPPRKPRRVWFKLTLKVAKAYR